MLFKPKPSGSRWTDEQWQAISARGNNILVAAAAGSGKTAVLVERIIQSITDPDHPVDVDRLLVVTYTNAAAAEMRQRIGQALEKALAKEPHSPHLRRQLSLLNRAMISTLHAFCLSILRKHYYLLNLDPQFRLANETEAELLREEVLEELLEEEYGKPDNTDFFALVDGYTSDRGDGELAALISKVYDFSRSHPDPEGWLNRMAASYRLKGAPAIDHLPWGRELFQSVKLDLDGCCSLLKQAIVWSKATEGPAAYTDQLVNELQQIERLTQAASWEEMREAYLQVQFAKLKPVRGEVNPELREKVKAAREEVKKQFEKLGDLFIRPPEELLDDLPKMAPLVGTLVRLVRSFGDRYWAAKQARGLVDFSDLEHLALAILSQNQSGEKGDGEWSSPYDDSSIENGDSFREIKDWAPSAVALDLSRQFEEILVDEYQDTNMVQETILQLISRGNNLFMVGDVKQSIYRFRLAEPNLFLSKYKVFTRSGDGPGLRIDLSRNFRSRKEVLDAVNFLFYQTMDEQVGEIAYDEQAALKPGLNFPDQEETPVELMVINRGDPHESPGDEKPETEQEDVSDQSEQADEEELETAQLEARLIARQIKILMNKPYQVMDKESGRLRPLIYRDIVILMRSMPWAPVMMEEFREAGIPVYAEMSTGYFEAVEISTMLSLLRVIDNPDQDIPLAAVLRSPIVGLNENELAQVRLESRQGSYFSAMKTACKTLAHTPLGQKLNQFYDQLQVWRARAREGALSELIWQVYRETGYYDFVGGLPGGKQRQANLRALYDRARSYESTSFRGLYRFLRYIERIQDRGNDLGTARALGEQEDVVRLLTIHKSKGLEFPVVFVAGLGKSFNTRDLSSPVLLHKQLGFGLRFVDSEARLAYPTLPQMALKERLKREMLAEEMRILYVALTRAREKLYLVGSVRDGAKALNRWQSAKTHTEWLLPVYERVRAAAYLDWIGPAVVRHREGQVWQNFEGNSITAGDGGEPSQPEVVQHPSRWKTILVEHQELADRNVQDHTASREDWLAVAEGRPVDISSPFQGQVKEQLSWEYPFKAAEKLRSKQTVTELKRMWQTEESGDLPLGRFSQMSAALRPRFIQGQASFSATERGTIMHLVMQHVNLKAPITHDILQRLVENMVERELLTPKQAEAVDVEDILAFFSSAIGQRLQRAPFVEREVPFSLGLPAREVYQKGRVTLTLDEPANNLSNEGPDGWHAGGGEEEVVLIQGVIDCLFRDEQGLVLLDYKTDTITGRFASIEEARPILLDRYLTQVTLYRRAVEEIWQDHVDELYLYFFDGGHLLKVSEKKGGESGAPVAHR
jgi:ATP-dependent helicase/nuclease subunit A